VKLERKSLREFYAPCGSTGNLMVGGQRGHSIPPLAKGGVQCPPADRGSHKIKDFVGWFTGKGLGLPFSFQASASSNYAFGREFPVLRIQVIFMRRVELR